MKLLLWGIPVALLAGSTTVYAQGRGHAAGVARDEVHGSVHVTFSTGDVQVIREYYGTRYRSLPPGLQKKYARTGQLPPGWQKKMEPLAPEVERRLVLLPPGYRRGIVDGRAVIIDDRTHVLVDVAAVF
jgi:hypothetical protein